MKHARFAGLLSLLAVVGTTCCGHVAQAATFTLSIAGSSSPGTIFQGYMGVPWTNQGTVESTTYWNDEVAHYNNLTIGQTYSTEHPNGIYGAGSSGTITFNIHFQTNGTYECYVIDKGFMNYGTPNSTAFSDSTNHITTTISVN